jgi:hypothetical protein
MEQASRASGERRTPAMKGILVRAGIIVLGTAAYLGIGIALAGAG